MSADATKLTSANFRVIMHVFRCGGCLLLMVVLYHFGISWGWGAAIFGTILLFGLATSAETCAEIEKRLHP